MNADTIQYLTVAQVEKLLAIARKASKRDHAILLVGYRHGLRASEIGMLERADVDFTANRLRLRRLKKSLGGDHVMQADEAKALRSYLSTRDDRLPYLFISRNSRPISRGMLDVLMKRYGEEAKLPPDRRHFHVLKHSIAVHLAGAVDLLVIHAWLGHKRIENTMVYTSLRSERRDAEVTRAMRSKHTA